jgi:putative membrane protein
MEDNMKLIIRWFITFIALMVAGAILPGMHVVGTSAWVAYAILALALGFANAFIRPVLKFFSCGCIVLTMGIFLLVVNGLTLYAAAWIANSLFGIGFYLDSFWTAILASVIVSIVSFILNMFISDDKK